MTEEYETVGKLGTRRQVGAFEFMITEYARTQRAARHSHELASFTLTLGGGYTERAVGVPLEHAPGSLVYKPSGEPHSNLVQAGTNTLLIRFAGRTPDRAQLDLPILDETFALRDREVVALATRMRAELADADECSDLSLQCRVFELLSKASKHRAHRSPALRSATVRLARDWLHAHFAERLDLCYIAERIGVTPPHLARAFRSALGVTLGQYQRQLRVDHVIRELRGSATITAVAHAAGFVDQSHCNRVFRRHVGVTPGEFRARLR